MDSQSILTAPTKSPGSPWSFDDAAAYVGVSARHLFRLADAGKLRTIYIGRRRLIPDAEVQRLVTEGAKR